MPLEIINPQLDLKFSLRENHAPKRDFRFSVLDIVETFIIYVYTDEDKTVSAGKYQLLTLDSASNHLVFDETPTELYSDGIRILDCAYMERFVRLPSVLGVGAKVVAAFNNLPCLYLIEDKAYVTQVYLTSSLQETISFLSDNAVTNEVGNLQLSLDGTQFFKSLTAIFNSALYVRPSLQMFSSDSINCTIDDILVGVGFDNNIAGDLALSIDTNGNAVADITGHDGITCGVEYLDAAQNTVEWIGHSGILIGLNPARPNTIKAFTLVEQAKTYIGTVVINRLFELPIMTKLGCKQITDVSVVSHITTLTPGTNPVMQG